MPTAGALPGSIVSKKTRAEAHGMKPDKLVYMANQIATFFTSKPHDEGVEGVAGHINKFWEPRMRAQLFEIAEGDGRSGLHELVREALASVNRPDPARFATPTARATG